MKENFSKITARWQAYHWSERLMAINLVWVGLSNFFIKIFLAYIPGEVAGYLAVVFLSLFTFVANIFVGSREKSIYVKMLFYVAAVLVLIGSTTMRLHSPLDTVYYFKTIFLSINHWIT